MRERERLLLTGHAHHLLRQARDGERVFREHTDYVHGVRLLHELAAEHGVALHAWCLLPDRLHLLATPLGDPWGLSVFMKALSCRVALRHRERHRSPSPWRRRGRGRDHPQRDRAPPCPARPRRPPGKTHPRPADRAEGRGGRPRTGRRQR